MKYISIIFMVLSANAMAERFDGEERKVTEVGGYSQNVNYDQNHCVIYFDRDLPSQCHSKNRGIVYLDKAVGNVMCSVSLTALAAGNTIKVSSFDDCDPIHRAPVLRWVSVKRN